MWPALDEYIVKLYNVAVIPWLFQSCSFCRHLRPVKRQTVINWAISHSLTSGIQLQSLDEESCLLIESVEPFWQTYAPWLTLWRPHWLRRSLGPSTQGKLDFGFNLGLKISLMCHSCRSSFHCSGLALRKVLANNYWEPLSLPKGITTSLGLGFIQVLSRQVHAWALSGHTLSVKIYIKSWGWSEHP